MTATRATTDAPPAGMSRRGFLRRAASALAGSVGVTGLGVARARRAEAATVWICDGCLLVCGNCDTCHECYPQTSGCCKKASLPKDLHYRKINDSGVERTCTGETGGPCCANPKYCYGSPPTWSSPFTTKYCCQA